MSDSFELFNQNSFWLVALFMLIKDVLHSMYFYDKKNVNFGLYLASWGVTLFCFSINFAGTLLGIFLAFAWEFVDDGHETDDK